MSKYLRNAFITECNYDYSTYEKLKDWGQITYGVIGKETCPSTGTPHIHAYIEFKSSVLWSTIKNKCPRADIQPRKKTQENCIKYCKKDDDFIEWGTPSKQGERIDLKFYIDSIINGELTVDDILVTEPMIYHQYGRTLIAAESRIKIKTRNWITKAEWYYGPTDTGKTHTIGNRITELGYDLDKDVWSWSDDNGWWDSYNGQPVVIFNEYRCQIPYSTLLLICNSHPTIDKWYAPRRNKDRVPFTSKWVFFSSPYSPEEAYHNLNDKDSINQLLRRLDIFWKPNRSEVVKRGNISTLLTPSSVDCSRIVFEDDDGDSDLSTTPVAPLRA